MARLNPNLDETSHLIRGRRRSCECCGQPAVLGLYRRPWCGDGVCGGAIAMWINEGDLPAP